MNRRIPLRKTINHNYTVLIERIYLQSFFSAWQNGIVAWAFKYIDEQIRGVFLRQSNRTYKLLLNLSKIIKNENPNFLVFI